MNHIDYHEIILQPHDILKRQRIALGLTQQEVANRACIPLQSYQQFENGTRDITRASFRLACRVFEALDINPFCFHMGKYAIL